MGTGGVTVWRCHRRTASLSRRERERETTPDATAEHSDTHPNGANYLTILRVCLRIALLVQVTIGVRLPLMAARRARPR
jgi:hypothetical protein